jgi:hypothetical protein
LFLVLHMAEMGVLDGEFVQPELFLQRFEFARLWVLDRHPHEAVGPAGIGADVFDGYVGDLFAVLIRDAVDEHLSPPLQLELYQIPRARQATQRLGRHHRVDQR